MFNCPGIGSLEIRYWCFLDLESVHMSVQCLGVSILGKVLRCILSLGD